MRTSARLLSFPVIVMLSVTACTQTESITDPGLQISAARPVSGPSYVAQEVGFLPGDVQSIANGVNDLGYVVGVSLPPANASPWNYHAFLRAGSSMVALSMDGSANAVSGGSPIYVAGEVHGFSFRPARWTYNPSTETVAEEILASSGNTADINDAGLVIGTTNDQATLWPVGGTPVTIPPTSGYTRSTGRGINNAGHAAVTFHGTFPRGFLMVNGNPIELIPAAGHTMSFAGRVSNPVGGRVYVSGISASDVETDYHMARWTVDVGNGSLVSVEARPEVSEGAGVSDGGVRSGQIEGKRSASTIAWTLTGTIPLKPTKGGSVPNAYDISSTGEYIVGTALYKGFSERGLLWTLTP